VPVLAAVAQVPPSDEDASWKTEYGYVSGELRIASDSDGRAAHALFAP